MVTCTGWESLQHSFSTVRDAVISAKEYDTILAGSELLARSQEKWMSLYRCRECSRLWVESSLKLNWYDPSYFYKKLIPRSLLSRGTTSNWCRIAVLLKTKVLATLTHRHETTQYSALQERINN